MNALTTWIRERTGLVQDCGQRRAPCVPGGASWWNVWPSTILFTTIVLALTGFVLWMYYSPSAQTAWESVYYIQHEVAAGWLVRGIHHYAAQVLVALTVIYIVQMVLRGTYRAPRELVFWAAILLAAFTMALVLTGDLLPWTQNSYWATQVRVKFLTLLPVVGGELFKLAAGGPQFGHFTLTRFFALHAGLFTALLLGTLAVHAWLRHRAAQLAAEQGAPMGWYWPDQAVRNMTACAIVAVVIGLLTAQNAFRGDHSGMPAGAYLGAELGAPADPADAYAAARPEWSLLGVYGFSHLFPGEWQLLPIFVIPSLVGALVMLMPFIGRFCVGHVFNIVLLLGLLGGIVYLSYEVIAKDRADARHQASLAAGQADAERIVALATSPSGIPATGALGLLRGDAKTQGPKLFAQHCASCHNYSHPVQPILVAEPSKPSAPELYNYASEAWLRGLFDPKQIAGPNYFGNTENFKEGDMVDFVQNTLKDILKEDEELKESFPQVITALAAEAKLAAARKVVDDGKAVEGIDEDTMFLFEDFTCDSCHKFYTKGSLGMAPELTGYGSREWLIGIITDPTHERFYSSNNERMPAYGKEPAMLTPRQIEMVAEWLRGEWYQPK